MLISNSYDTIFKWDKATQKKACQKYGRLGISPKVHSLKGVDGI